MSTIANLLTNADAGLTGFENVSCIVPDCMFRTKDTTVGFVLSATYVETASAFVARMGVSDNPAMLVAADPVAVRYVSRFESQKPGLLRIMSKSEVVKVIVIVVPSDERRTTKQVRQSTEQAHPCSCSDRTLKARDASYLV